jgi:hypothetical protein
MGAAEDESITAQFNLSLSGTTMLHEPVTANADSLLDHQNALSHE